MDIGSIAAAVTIGLAAGAIISHHYSEFKAKAKQELFYCMIENDFSNLKNEVDRLKVLSGPFEILLHTQMKSQYAKEAVSQVLSDMSNKKPPFDKF